MRIPLSLLAPIRFLSASFLLSFSSQCTAEPPSCYLVTDAKYRGRVLWTEIGSQYQVESTRLRVITAGPNPELQQNVAEVSQTESGDLRVVFWNSEEPEARHLLTISPFQASGVHRAVLRVVESRSSSTGTVLLELRPVDSNSFKRRAKTLIDQARDLDSNAFDSFLTRIANIKDSSERPVRDFAELVRESDAIVIGELVSKSPIELGQQSMDAFARESVVCISNRVRVVSSLKGTPASEIDVITLRVKRHALVSAKHDFATLRQTLSISNPDITEIDRSLTCFGLIGNPTLSTKIEPEYLLFLRKRPDGRFDPVTGQRYSGMSVKLLND